MVSRPKRSKGYRERLNRKVARDLATGKIRCGTAYEIEILHDDWCNLIRGIGDCNCEPEIHDARQIPTIGQN